MGQNGLKWVNKRFRRPGNRLPRWPENAPPSRSNYQPRRRRLFCFALRSSPSTPAMPRTIHALMSVSTGIRADCWWIYDLKKVNGGLRRAGRRRPRPGRQPSEHAVEIGDGLLQPILGFHRRRPVELVPGAGDVGTALQGIVFRQRQELNRRCRAGHLDNQFGQL